VLLLLLWCVLCTLFLCSPSLPERSRSHATVAVAHALSHEHLLEAAHVSGWAAEEWLVCIVQQSVGAHFFSLKLATPHTQTPLATAGHTDKELASLASTERVYLRCRFSTSTRVVRARAPCGLERTQRCCG